MAVFGLASSFVFLVLIRASAAASCWRDTSCTGPADTAFPGPWESNIYAPASRSIKPKTVLSIDGSAQGSYTGSITLKGNGSAVVLDFGAEVGGIVSFSNSATGNGAIGLAFSEAKNWIGEWSDYSNGAFKGGADGAIYDNFTEGKSTYVMPAAKLRGGFRYLTLFLITDGSITATISEVSLEIGFQPTWSNLRAYQGYFHSNDETLNKIWYSGAYTLQTNAVPVNTGRWVPMLVNGWANNGTLGPGDTIIVDGAKRDRAVWPGDMGVAVPSSFVSIGDLDSVKNALQTMYNHQNADGSFPEAGPPLLQQGSDTYHMWSMIGTYNYVLYTNNTSFLAQNWAGYLRAMDYIYGKVRQPSGLLNVTGTRDWARWQQGFNNSEANMILYRTLITGASLASWVPPPDKNATLSNLYLSRAAALKDAINTYCYDAPYGAYKDNATATALHPQDANSMSLLFGVAPAAHQSSISTALTRNWTPIGAVAPELPENISPFISSFEVQGHFTIGRADRALDLIRRSWGWYLNNPNGTQSTVIEGYLANATFGYRSSRGYGYDPSYVSHSHGWSSGPTSALTEFVLGLTITGPAGATWSLKPQFGDLKTVEGGFTTSLGKYQAKWMRSGLGYVIEVSAPAGTKGEVVLPCPKAGIMPVVAVNGRLVKVGDKQLGVSLQASGVSMSLGGGQHIIVVV